MIELARSFESSCLPFLAPSFSLLTSTINKYSNRLLIMAQFFGSCLTIAFILSRRKISSAMFENSGSYLILLLMLSRVKRTFLNSRRNTLYSTFSIIVTIRVKAMRFKSSESTSDTANRVKSSVCGSISSANFLIIEQLRTYLWSAGG